jgi:hypothetical protein
MVHESSLEIAKAVNSLEAIAAQGQFSNPAHYYEEGQTMILDKTDIDRAALCGLYDRQPTSLAASFEFLQRLFKGRSSVAHVGRNIA